MNCIPILNFQILSDNSYVDKYGLTFFRGFCSLMSPQRYIIFLIQFALGSFRIWTIVDIVSCLTEYTLGNGSTKYITQNVCYLSLPSWSSSISPLSPTLFDTSASLASKSPCQFSGSDITFK